MRDVLEMGLGERKVVVDRRKLLEKLHANRAKHQDDYREAVAGYRLAAAERLSQLYDRAAADLTKGFEKVREKIKLFDPASEDRLGDTVVLLDVVRFNLRVPQDHTRSYDVAIAMAEWEVGDTVELTQSQFQCFILDDWDWRSDFDSVTKTYKSFNFKK